MANEATANEATVKTAKTTTTKTAAKATKKVAPKATAKKDIKAPAGKKRADRVITLIKKVELNGNRGKTQKLIRSGMTVASFKEAAAKAKVKFATSHLRWAQGAGLIKVA